MADLNFPGLFAGSFDPSKVAKFGWNVPKDMPSFGAFSLAGPSDPYAGLKEKYGRAAFDPSILKDPEAQSLYAVGRAFQPDINTMIAGAEIQKIAAQEANKMSRENLKLAEEAAIRQQGRDFTFGQAANLIAAIPRAFSPIPFDKTQEVVANIANIASPLNRRAIPQLQQAQFSMPNRQYFG